MKNNYFRRLLPSKKTKDLIYLLGLLVITLFYSNTSHAQIGLAKAAYEFSGRERAEPGPNGTYTLHYRFEVENFEGGTMTNVLVVDDLAGNGFGTFNTTAQTSQDPGDLGDGEYFIFTGDFGGDRLDVNNGNLDINNNYDGQTDTELLLNTSEVPSGAQYRIFLHVVVKPSFANGGIYSNTAIAFGTEGGEDFTDISWDDEFESDPDDDDDPTNNADPAVLAVCMPNGVCGPDQTHVGFDNVGWNGSGWIDGDDDGGADPNNALLAPQVWNNFDGMGNNVTATFSGNTPSGGTPGPNVYTGNPFGCLSALRLTGSNSASTLADFPTETIQINNAIPFNQFFVGGQEGNRESNIDRSEVSIVTFSNGGATIDPRTFTYNELTPSDVAYGFIGNSIYIWGTTDNSDGLLLIDLGGVLVDEVVWSVGEVIFDTGLITASGNDLNAGDLTLTGGQSSQWITGFCVNEPACPDPNCVSTSIDGIQQPSATVSTKTLDFNSALSWESPNGPNYPFNQTVEVDGVDITVVVNDIGQDEDYFNDECSPCNFTDLAPYTGSTSAFRYFQPIEDEIYCHTVTFEELVKLGTFAFGGNRSFGNENGVIEITLWDGPDGTGNQVIPPNPASMSTLNPNGPDPLPGNTVINALYSTGMNVAYDPVAMSWISVGLDGTRRFTVIDAMASEVRSIQMCQYGTSVSDPLTARNNRVAPQFNSGYLIGGAYEITNCDDTIYLVCDDGSNSLTLEAEAGLTMVEWFNSADQSVGTGSTLMVNSNTNGLGDGSEAFYYTAADGSGCPVELCCPVMVETESCTCPALPPTAMGASRCGEGSVDLTATASADCDELRWYTVATGGTSVFTGVTYTTPSISTTTSYYVACFDADLSCESARVEVVATINSDPSVSGNPAEVCVDDELSLAITATGNGSLSYSWTGPMGFTSNDEDPTINTNATAGMAGTYTVVVTDDQGTPLDVTDDCATTTDIIATVNPRPSITATAVCDAVNATYSITVTTNNATGLTSSEGMVSGTAPSFTVSGITIGNNVILTANNATTGCSNTAAITSPVCVSPVSLGDFTFVDLNNNGVQDVGDIALEGVTVTVFNSDGTPVIEDADGNAYTNMTTTNNAGFYEFTNLPEGNYYVVFDLSTVANNEFFDFTTANAGNDANDSDADPATGQSDNTGPLQEGANFPNLDAGVICNVTAQAGTPQTVCSTASVDLTTIGASFTPTGLAGFTATWTTSGDGTFTGGADFATATAYVPGTEDIASGSVTLTLTTTDPNIPPFANAVCGPAEDEVTITILKVDCGQFPWEGN